MNLMELVDRVLKRHQEMAPESTIDIGDKVVNVHLTFNITVNNTIRGTSVDIRGDEALKMLRGEVRR